MLTSAVAAEPPRCDFTCVEKAPADNCGDPESTKRCVKSVRRLVACPPGDPVALTIRLWYGSVPGEVCARAPSSRSHDDTLSVRTEPVLPAGGLAWRAMLRKNPYDPAPSVPVWLNI